MQDQQISLQVSSQKNWYVLTQMRKQQTRKELKTKIEIYHGFNSKYPTLIQSKY